MVVQAARSAARPPALADFGYLLPRDDRAWIDYVNLWVDLAKLKGDFGKLQQKWIR